MSAESLHASAKGVLEGWETSSEADESLRHTMLAFLDSAPDGCLRRHAPGHITASSLVLDESGCHVLADPASQGGAGGFSSAATASPTTRRW